MAARQEMQAVTVEADRVADLLADAAEFFEAQLWESRSGRVGRDALVEQGLDEKVIRAFGVGYAPVGPEEVMDHLRGLGYSTAELLAAGLANRSPRGRAHAHFRSRVMFPVRDREGRVLGFAGLGTHLGPSWALWVTSPDVGLYRRSHAVFALDRATRQIAARKTALVLPDSIEVLRAHQDGRRNAVTVHSSDISREQVRALAEGVPGGVEALDLRLPPGMGVESSDRLALEAVPGPARSRDADQSSSTQSRPHHLELKLVAVVTATALAAINAWTGAPLLAVWVGSQVQSERLLSMPGVLTVLGVLAVLAFLLGWALTWLSAKYDELTGRPRTAGQTSPWQRAKRGDRVEDIRSRYGISAPEKAVAASVVVAVLVFEVWFFFFAGSSL